MAEFDLLSNDADMAHAIRTYSQQIRLKCAYTVDPITQEATNILDSFVPLRVLEGDQVADLLKQTVDLDKQAEQELLKARVNSARGVGVEEYDYSAADAINKLLPSTADNDKRVLCCLLG